MALLQHPRRLWGPWWLLPGGVPLAYVLMVALVGDFRPEHGLVVLLCLVLAYATPRTKQFFLSASPYLITGIAYDGLRYPRAALVTSSRVMGCGLRSAELRLFGVDANTTLQDWFAVHHTAALDLLCAAPYFAFAYVVLGYAIYLYFVDRPRMHHFLWSYAVANFIAFGFWLFLPAAPPWYLRAHGCLIDMTAAPSAAALLRVDELLGFHYFAQFYSRATSVFGALPSMHCAFPLIGLLTAWKHITWRTRPIHIAYAALMAFSAVYLDHHWVIDVLAGWAVAFVSVAVAAKMMAAFRLWAASSSFVQVPEPSAAVETGPAGGAS